MGAACAVAAAIQAAVQTSAEARVAASGWPKASVLDISAGQGLANRGPVLWDGSWIASESLGGGDTVAPLRRVIVAALQAASPECLDEAQSVPQGFVTLAGDGRGGQAFTIGSALWRWRDLLGDQETVATVESAVPRPDRTP